MKRIKLNPTSNPYATATGRWRINDAADKARAIKFLPRTPELDRALRLINSGTAIISRGAITTGLSEFDSGIAALQAQGLLIPEDK